jgi:hypothetical protein
MNDLVFLNKKKVEKISQPILLSFFLSNERNS